MKTTLKWSGLRQALVLFLVFGLHLQSISAKDVDQNGRLTLSLTNVTLKTVFSNIEEKTDFSLFYENDLVDLNSIVSVEGSNLSIEKILTQVLNGQGIDFNIVNKQIVLSEKQVKTLGNANLKSEQTLKTVTGVVADASGETLPGVNVTVKGQSKGTQTDFDGNYTINVEDTDVLVFSYVGFKTVEQAVGSSTTVNVSLEEDASALNEVVVIGYGTAKKSDLAGSVSQLSTEAFEEQPITRVEDAIQGRIAGVALTKPSGNPGGDTKIRIRGVNSITGDNNPLVVVDGIFGGDLRTINPNDIASIEVLKDASATAIYGSRGSNGVILITTKKGKGKPKVSIDYFTSIATLRDKLEYYQRPGGYVRNNFEDLSIALGGDDAVNAILSDPIDAEDELFRAAYTNNVQASVSGGEDKFNYFISANYADQEGVMITNDYDRYSFRANLESQVNDKLKVGFNVYTSREENVNSPDAFPKGRGGAVIATLTHDPTVRYRVGDQYVRSGFTLGTIGNRGRDVPFPIELRNSDITRTDYRTNLNLNIKYDIIDGLSYSFVGGAGVFNRRINELRITSPLTSDRSEEDIARVVNNNAVNYQISNIVNWNKSFGDHNFDITAVYELQETKSENFGTTIENLENSELFANVFTAPLNAFDGDTESGNSANTRAIQSGLARLQYNFNSSLYLTGSVRVDESSVFSKENRVGYFPSAAIAYSFKNLNLLEKSNVFSDVKLRASWGQTGNQNIAGGATRDGFMRNVTTLRGEQRSIPIQNRVGNPNLVWETTEQWDAGVDLGFFDNRLNFSFDYYQKSSKDLLLATLFADTDNVTFFQNVGEIENKGFDVSLYGDVIDTDDFNWTSGVTISHVKNEVVDLDGDREFIGVDSPNASGDPSVALSEIRLGQPLGNFLGRRFTGVDSDGNATYEDNGEDGFDRKVIGNGTPTITWGFNNTLSYKKFDFNMFWTGAAGFDVYNQTRAAIEGDNNDFLGNLSRNNVPGNNVLNSSRYVEKGDYIRLSNLSLGYTLENPLKSVSAVKFTVSGQNLLLITDYTGYDPEVNSGARLGQQGTSDQFVGIDRGAIPNPRTITLGVKLDF